MSMDDGRLDRTKRIAQSPSVGIEKKQESDRIACRAAMHLPRIGDAASGMRKAKDVDAVFHFLRGRFRGKRCQHMNRISKAWKLMGQPMEESSQRIVIPAGIDVRDPQNRNQGKIGALLTRTAPSRFLPAL